MKIEYLAEGQVIKNYKELCLILDIKPTSKANNSRIAQLKELARYCKYHKEGHKFIIDEIYAERQPKADKRSLGNNNNQSKCIRYLLCNLLSKYKIEKDEVVTFSKSRLLEKLGLINHNYTNAKVYRKQYAKAMEVTKLAIDECIKYVDNRSINAIKKAIQVLINQKVIGYKYSYTWVDKEWNYNDCTIYEHNAIMKAEYEVMEGMNIRNKGKIYEFGRWDEFKDRVNEYLIKHYRDIFFDIQYHYSSFHFYYNVEQLQKYIIYMETEQKMNYQKARLTLQEVWSNSLDTTIKNKHSKKSEKSWGNEFYTVDNYRKSNSFISEQKEIKNSITQLNYRKVKLKF